MILYQSPGKQHTYSRTCDKLVGGVPAPEHVSEQFLLILLRNAYTRVRYVDVPVLPVMRCTHAYRSSPRSIFQSVRNQVPQYRVHLVAVYPHLKTVESAFILQRYPLLPRIVAELSQILLQISVQFIFPYVGLLGVELFLLEVHQFVGQFGQILRVLQRKVYVHHTFFRKLLVFKNLPQRRLDQRKRSTYVVGRMYEEVYLLLRNASVLFNHLVSVERESRSAHEYDIQHDGPWSGPQRTVNHYSYAPFLQQLIVFLQNGTYPQSVLARRDIRISYHSVLTWCAPFVEETLQFPRVVYVRRIVIIHR